MKKTAYLSIIKYLFGSFLFLLPTISNAQGTVCNGGNSINLTTQAQVDNFVATYGTCNNVRTLRISGSDITNLDGLSNLRFIGNSLYIQNLPNLTSLNGLSNLRTIFGNLIMNNCPKITNLNAFSELGRLDLELRLFAMTSLTSIDGISNVAYIRRIRIYNNQKLASCCALYDLITHPNAEIVSMYGNAGNCNSNGNAIKANPNDATISVTETDGTANDGAICRGNSAQLTASGKFSFEWAADATLSATNIANPIATPTYSKTYSVTIRGCNNTVATKSMAVTVKEPIETPADAGPTQIKLNETSFTLAANTPTVGVGRWSIDRGWSATSISNLSDPNATVELPIDKSVALIWTISNSACTSSDEVILRSKRDSDNDGIPDDTDNCDDLIDSDGDGISDCTDPCDDRVDADEDGIMDCVDDCDNRIDSDGDGLEDCFDNCDDRIDTDGDGTSDCKDECPRDPLKTIKDACGCGTPPQIDSDGDGIINCMDPCPYDLNQYVDGTIECGKTIKGSSRLGQRIINNYGAYSEDFDFNGPELFYKLTVHAPTDLVINYKENNRNGHVYQTKLFVMNDLCSPESCIGSIKSLGKTEVLTIPNAAAGDYFIAIDGRDTYDNANFELTVNCGAGGGESALTACGEDNLIFEDFQTYAEGDDIAEMGVDWALYGTSSQTAYVNMMDEESENMGLSFDRYKGSSDISLVIGNEMTGVWRVAWDMYIQPDATAYFNVMGMKGTDDYGVKYLTKQSDIDLQNRWINVEVFIDLDNDRYELMMDNRSKSISGDYVVNLRKVNFYAAPYADFSIDNVCVSKVVEMPVSLSRTALLETDHLQTKELLSMSETATNVSTIDEIKLTTKAISQTLKVFPNPVKDVLTVQLPNTGQGQLMIFNILGKQVWTQALSKDTEQIDLNIAHFEKGMYQLVVQQKGTMFSKKFIKQ